MRLPNTDLHGNHNGFIPSVHSSCDDMFCNGAGHMYAPGSEQEAEYDRETRTEGTERRGTARCTCAFWQGHKPYLTTSSVPPDLP